MADNEPAFHNAFPLVLQEMLRQVSLNININHLIDFSRKLMVDSHIFFYDFFISHH